MGLIHPHGGQSLLMIGEQIMVGRQVMRIDTLDPRPLRRGLADAQHFGKKSRCRIQPCHGIFPVLIYDALLLAVEDEICQADGWKLAQTLLRDRVVSAKGLWNLFLRQHMAMALGLLPPEVWAKAEARIPAREWKRQLQAAAVRKR